MGTGQDGAYLDVVRLDGHGLQQLLGMHDSKDERARPNACQRPVVGTTPASQPVPGAIGRHRGHHDNVGVLEGKHACATVDAKFQVPVSEHRGQQYRNPSGAQRVQGRPDVRLAPQCHVTSDDAGARDFGDGEQGLAQSVVGIRAGGTRSQQPRPQRGLPRLVSHAN